jgi:3-hydroxyisobutyrate dehydrogenase
MGAPMARNVARSGCAVSAWNRSPGKARPLADAGVHVAETAFAAAEGCDVLVTMLADATAVDALMTGPGGVLEALADGAVWIQMSTVGVPATERLAAVAAHHGAGFVDAPVLGSREPAESGELIVLASGPVDLRDRCAPVLSAVGTRTLWLATAGMGSALKVVVNAWLMASAVALAETLALGEALGVDADAFFDVTDRGAIGALYTDLNATAMVNRSFTPRFPLALAAKDAALALECSGETHVAVLEASQAQFARAVDLGHGELDWSAVLYAALPD